MSYNFRQVRIALINLFIENKNTPVHFDNLIKNFEDINKEYLKTYLDKKIKFGEIKEPELNYYHLSEGLYKNFIKRKRFNKVNFEIEEMRPSCNGLIKEVIDNFSQQDIYDAFNVSEPVYFENKNRVSDIYNEHLNFEFLLENNYFIQKTIGKNSRANINYDFSGKQKQYFILESSEVIASESDYNIVIPLFPVYIYLLKKHLTIEFRQEYNLDSFEYFLQHLIKNIPRITIIHSTRLGKSILYKIENFYKEEFYQSINNAVLRERDLRLKIWSELNQNIQKLKTFSDWNDYVVNKYNIFLRGEQSDPIYRELRRTKQITKDDIGLAFSIQLDKKSFKVNKEDDNTVYLPFIGSFRVVRSMNALYEYDLPLFVIDSRSTYIKIWIGRLVKIHKENKTWEIELSTFIKEDLNIFQVLGRTLKLSK